MKTFGLAILAIIAFAVIIVLVAIEIIEFTIGLILFVAAAVVLYFLYRWVKNKIED